MIQSALKSIVDLTQRSIEMRPHRNATIQQLSKAFVIAILLGICVPTGHAFEHIAKPPEHIELDRVIWWKAVDGLQSGFLFGRSQAKQIGGRIANNSVAEYRILIRNTTKKRIDFVARMIDHQYRDAPYLIPSSNLATALQEDKLPAEHRAKTNTSTTRKIRPAYWVSLQPKESVFVPGQSGLDRFSIYFGKDADKGLPTIESVEPGMNWIVHPLQIHTLDDLPKSTSLRGRFALTKIDSKGITQVVPAARMTAVAGGKVHYPRIQLEVGTLNAAASQNARLATWGNIDKGLQCGIRLLDEKTTYRIGDVISAEVMWRNASAKSIASALPRQLDLFPTVEDEAGRSIPLDYGARFILLPPTHVFEPNEVRSLGIVRVKIVREGTPSPKSNIEPAHAVLNPSTYKLRAWGGVSFPNGGNPESGSIQFTVANAASTEKKALDKQRKSVTARVEKLGGNVRRYDKTGVAVDLFETKADDKDVESLKCFELVALALGKTQITDTALPHLSKMSRLGDLDMTRTRVTDKGLASLKGLEKLEYLSLCETSVTDAGLKQLTGLKSLIMLNVERTKITDAAMTSVGRLNTLHTLILSRTKIADEGIAKLRNLKSLRDLRLDGTAISNQSMDTVAAFPKLQTLTLNQTKLGDAGIMKLASLKSLKKLFIQRTSVSKAAIESLQKSLPGCEIVR